MAKPKTNMQIVKHLFEHCPTGALSQAFIMHAIRWMAEETLKNPPEKYDSVIMNGQAWWDTAKWIDAQTREFYR